MVKDGEGWGAPGQGGNANPKPCYQRIKAPFLLIEALPQVVFQQ